MTHSDFRLHVDIPKQVRILQLWIDNVARGHRNPCIARHIREVSPPSFTQLRALQALAQSHFPVTFRLWARPFPERR